MSTQLQLGDVDATDADADADVGVEPRDSPPVTGRRAAAATTWTRTRLDYLQELPAPGSTWSPHDLDAGAQEVFETLRRDVEWDIIVAQRTTTTPDRTTVTFYETDAEWWAFIQHLRDERAEFACGHGAGVHHVDETGPDSEKRFTCGNEYCDARYTRAEVKEAMRR